MIGFILYKMLSNRFLLYLSRGAISDVFYAFLYSFLKRLQPLTKSNYRTKEFGKPVIGTKEHNTLRFIVSDTQSFQNERKYDLVISSEVLMYVLPSEIEKVVI